MTKDFVAIATPLHALRWNMLAQQILQIKIV